MVWPPLDLPWYYSDEYTAIAHGNCRDILPHLAPYIDVVLTDPPYGTGWARGGGRCGEFHAQHVDAPWDVWTLDWLTAHPTAFFGPASRQEEMLERCRALAWWHKTNPRPGAPRHIPIGLTHHAGLGTFTCYNGDTLYHPCEKPLPLMRWLVRHLTEPGAVLCDPFMGSGTTLRAAKDLGRRAIGIDVDDRYCAIAVDRLRQDVLALRYADGTKPMF